MNEKIQTWNCYILKALNKSYNYGHKTYVGSTNNLIRRLNQHNGLISGGAKKTMNDRPFDIDLFIQTNCDHKFILQLEWRVGHPDGKKRNYKYRTIESRINGIKEIFIKNKIWIKKISDHKELIYIFCKYKYYDLFEYDKLKYPNNIRFIVF
jgi:predicted GIY-YIG superfamily endonuclease